MQALRAMLGDSDSWVLPDEQEEGKAPPAKPKPPGRKLDAEERRTKTILLVEDDPDVRTAVLEVLAEEEFNAVAVRNGVEAIRYLHYVPRLPDLILLDLMMPVMDGWEFKKRFDKEPRWADIPIVIYSANTRAKPIAATVVLAKPVSIKQLMTTIEIHIKKKEE
jgi:CheY-like chemotaxis protein